MEREQKAAALLRRLWQHYDHGGHSYRSWHAQLLETTMRYRQRLLKEVSDEILQACLKDTHDVEELVVPQLPEQLRLFTESRYANDSEALCIVLWGLLVYYREEEDVNFYELAFVEKAARLMSLPEDGGTYRITFEQTDRRDLIWELRERSLDWSDVYARLL